MIIYILFDECKVDGNHRREKEATSPSIKSDLLAAGRSERLYLTPSWYDCYNPLP
jgi:hypothetical protein